MSKSPPEDSDDADETDDILNPAEKLKTAVHSFLRKSANLVNKIIATILKQGINYIISKGLVTRVLYRNNT